MNVTKQQVFDAAWNGLKGQGFRRAACVFGQNECCAIIHAARKLGHDISIAEIFGDEGYGLMECHDEATSPADMERRLREFAKAEGLTVPGDPDAFQAFMAKVKEPVDTKVPDSIVLKNGVRFVRYDY